MGDQASVCGLPIVELPDGITPLSAVVILKALDEEGDPAYYVRATDGLLSVEAAGMIAYADSRIRSRWIKGEEED